MHPPTPTISFRLERELHFRIRGEHSTGTMFIGDLVWLQDRNRWACHWSLAHVHPEKRATPISLRRDVDEQTQLYAGSGDTLLA